MTKATATIRDVARAAGVSVASASRAMNGHSNVTTKTRERVEAAAAALDYVPHLGARSLTMAKTNTIGVVLPDLFGEFFSEIIRGIDRVAHAGGLQLLLANMHGERAETAHAIRAMRGRVDGLLIMSPDVDADFLNANLPRGLPAVVLNGHITGVGHGSLSIDNGAGARAMVAHLVARGHRRIAHIAGPSGNSDADQRLAGFRAAMAELVGDTAPRVFAGDFTEAAGEAAGRAIAADGGIDAVFAANDVMAVGCMAALADAGVAVPGDVAVAGFDDVPIARYVTPGLTTMRVHIADLGARAFERLAALIAEPGVATPPDETLAPELVVRGSA
ncbi:LacI family transcriptional regulator [Sphingomonas donggukensis]|uniref:LacI family transcriptional regulator n=1 Tax=Sphingomonas donggukensis TaxID=2949093 RepID=A0ABY4TYU5_9SPHN|nr:LacI family DNA-binding transcriptional regulator [Sphingomonas donggukensis]URW75478.1 LacI family transcriptional regulator [Sphingomonas donggukensis]